ncbi:hypothetical protein [Kushneria phosphatilytica]|uniref:hypothetical protein n=1 Tax=Kushneria phosphatilytica TaxID=657387 RepID=UPI0008D908D4|nr:hypothetical protein [Kushneria phosphatilytica]OHV12154.1 hypothetical protein BH688_05740 [Kushneria phosphatilytica]
MTEFDPHYVRIGRQQAAHILGLSLSEFDRRRRDDPRCPDGAKDSPARGSARLFRLSDIMRIVSS